MSVPTHPTTARSRRSALAIGVLFLLTSVFTLAVPVATLAWSSGTFSSTSESELVAMTNRARASAGLKALKVDSTLHTVARWRSKDMIDRELLQPLDPGLREGLGQAQRDRLLLQRRRREHRLEQLSRTTSRRPPSSRPS